MLTEAGPMSYLFVQAPALTNSNHYPYLQSMLEIKNLVVLIITYYKLFLAFLLYIFPFYFTLHPILQ